VLIGGIIGFVVDIASGGMNTHDDNVTVNLESAPPPPPGSAPPPPVAAAVPSPASASTRIVDGNGTGVFVHPDGLVLTAYHVVHDAVDISIVLSDKSSAHATLANWDAKHDLAVLKIEKAAPAYVTPGSSDAI